VMTRGTTTTMVLAVVGRLRQVLEEARAWE